MIRLFSASLAASILLASAAVSNAQGPVVQGKLSNPNYECLNGNGCYRPHGKCKKAANSPWHCNYYHTEWGQPLALVVPPTAELQTNYGWGVGNTRVSKICQQYRRRFPGYDAGMGTTGQFLPTPVRPSDTSQFGVHYVRGPW